MSSVSGVVAIAVWVALLLISGAIVLALVRLIRGPTLPDRVVALDLFSALMVGFIGAYTVLTGEPLFLRVAIVLALLAFLGTVGFAFYLGRSRP